MSCKCRTLVVTSNNVDMRIINELNIRAKYYFVLVENNNVIIERASLIDGKTEDIKKEKFYLIEYIKEHIR